MLGVREDNSLSEHRLGVDAPSAASMHRLGVGTPADIPSWGNVMASGRQYFVIAPWVILFPGAFLSLLVLSINILGDHLRDVLDPRLIRRGAA